MTKELWVNLPVKDIEISKDFFEKIGFTFRPVPGNDPDTACMVIGTKGVVVMLFSEHLFQGFSNNAVSDNSGSSEVLFSIDAESRDEVDDLAEKVRNAGGTLYAGPGEKDGWMYGCGFSDPDGHRWSVLYMDMSKIQKG